MYTLVARDARGRVIATLPLTRRPLTVGRGAECTLVLPSTAVSRTHASIYLQEDGSAVVQDENSANGVDVDGRFITGPTVVGERNQIKISDYELSLELGERSQPVAQRLDSLPSVAEEGVEREEMMTLLEARVDAGALLAHTSIQLVGRGGPFDGTTFTVDKPLLTVGRVEPAELVLDDPSISRRHAQLRLSATGDRFTVLDLRSSNGTFVDGQKTKRSECSDGTIVRFGDLAFKVTLARHTAERKPKRRMGRKTLLIAATAVLLLIVGVGVVAKMLQPKPPPPKKTTAADRLRELQARVQRLVDKGKGKLAQKQWSAAIQAFDGVLTEDPLNTTAKSLRQQASTELQNQQVFVKGMEYLGFGNKENLLRAKDVFLRIPLASVYHREVRYKLRTINERLAEGYRIEGVSRCKARYWTHCHSALCKFFDLLPEGKVVPGESQLRRQLQRVEKRLGRKQGFVPCEAARFRSPAGVAAPGERPQDVLAEKYHVKPLENVLLVYFNGKIENALRGVNRLEKKRRMRPHLTMIREVKRHLLIIRGKYQEGFSAFRQRNAEEASRHWGMVLTSDLALIPPRIESFYRREVKRALGDLYYELGQDEFKLMRHRQAYTFWFRGKHYNDAHERILNGLLQLEAVADKLVREAKSAPGTAEARKKLETAKAITEEGRPSHQEAVKLLGGG